MACTIALVSASRNTSPNVRKQCHPKAKPSFTTLAIQDTVSIACSQIEKKVKKMREKTS